MELPAFSFQAIDWSAVPVEEHKGISGFAFWKVLQMGKIRIRLVEYSPGYRADHWCSKGHIIYCVEGEMDTELKDSRIFKIEKGMSYLVGDENEAHASGSAGGCKLFIVD